MVEGLASPLLRTLDMAQLATNRHLIASTDRHLIEKILKMLNAAIEQCLIRKEQITPLINAFAITVAPDQKP